MIHLHWGRRQFLLGVTLSLFVATESMSLSKYSVRQAINLPGIRKAMKAILKPSLLIPQISVKSVNELDFQEMKDNGISCIVFDKDNTLSYTYVDELHPSLVAKVDYVKTIFPSAVAILSNSVGSCDDRGYASAAKTEKAMDLPVIKHLLKKPSCLKEVLTHFESTLKRPVAPSEICMIGDRVLTDVVFANQYGMLSVLVAPLSLSKDHPIAVIIRLLETKVLLPLLWVCGIKGRTIMPNTRPRPFPTTGAKDD